MDETSLIKLKVTDDEYTEFGVYWRAVMTNFRAIDTYIGDLKTALETSASDNLSTAKSYSDTNLATAKSYADSAITTAINGALEATY